MALPLGEEERGEEGRVFGALQGGVCGVRLKVEATASGMDWVRFTPHLFSQKVLLCLNVSTNAAVVPFDDASRSPPPMPGDMPDRCSIAARLGSLFTKVLSTLTDRGASAAIGAGST